MAGTPFISGGVCRLLERRRLGDYEHREMSVELSFSTAEGDSRDISTQVVNECLRLLDQGMKDQIVRGPGRPPGAKNKPKDAAPDIKVIERTVGNTPARDPAAIDDEPVETVPQTSDKADPAEITDEPAAEAPPITDAALLRACADKAQGYAEADAPVADGGIRIRQLVWKYAGDGKRASDIPQAARRGFLADLAAMK